MSSVGYRQYGPNHGIKPHVANVNYDADMNDLQLHLISEHGVANVVGPQDALELHHREHFGPCGIRSHSYESYRWDGSKVVTGLLEGLDL